MSQMYQRLFIITILGFSSGLPLALVGSSLQAWFADAHQSLIITGMISLVGIPYVYRFFWSPLLDRFALLSIGRRRSWMLMMQIMLFLGLNLMAWLNPQQNANVMIWLAFFLASCSATQDVAIEAHRTEYLKSEEYGIGASLAVFGYRIAMLLSGGIALIIADHYSWKMSYHLMALFMVPGILVSLLTKEPMQTAVAATSLHQQFIRPFKDLLQRKASLSILLFIFFYKIGEAFTATTSGIVMPFLIDGLGFSLATIGWVNKIVAVFAVVVGGIFAGILMLRWSIGRCLMIFGLIQALTNLCFVVLAIKGQNLTWLLIAVISDNLATGMGTTALVAFLMHIVNKQFTASQLSILVAFSTIPRIISGPVGTFLQAKIGWVGLYQFSVLSALIYIPFLLKINLTNSYFSQEKDSRLSTLPN
jgi:PAT family beta-lactamase induction signal transducer AmpG